MNATTVNNTSSEALMPPFQSTSVYAYERTMERNEASSLAAYLLQVKITNFEDWYRAYLSLERSSQNPAGLTKILEQVYDSSSHSEVLNKIARIRTLISYWDKDFKAPSRQTITNTLEIAALFPKKIPIPKISLSSDGEISLELIKGKKHAVIDINDENEFSYAYFFRGKFVPGKEKGEFPAHKLPKDLLEYF